LIFTKLNELKPEMVEDNQECQRSLGALSATLAGTRESDKLSAALSGQNRFRSDERRRGLRLMMNYMPPTATSTRRFIGAACGCAVVGDRVGLAVPQQTHALHRFPFACHETPTPGCVPV
jgi:hypothetical protein